MERDKGIEPFPNDWQSTMQPLHQSRKPVQPADWRERAEMRTGQKLERCAELESASQRLEAVLLPHTPTTHKMLAFAQQQTLVNGLGGWIRTNGFKVPNLAV